MSGDLPSRLPRCGLYRTTQPLPSHEQQVPAGVLIYFHNHSDSGLPQVLLPNHSVHNRWHFHGPSIGVRGLSWASTLLALPAQGLYMLRGDFAFGGGKWPRHTLIQLGYSRAGEAVAFLARQQPEAEGNHVFFQDRGVGLGADRFHLLEGPLLVFTQPGSNHPEDLSHPSDAG